MDLSSVSFDDLMSRLVFSGPGGAGAPAWKILFEGEDIAKVSMQEVLKEMLPYYLPLGVTLLLITYVPGITTWIPTWALAK